MTVTGGRFLLLEKSERRGKIQEKMLEEVVIQMTERRWWTSRGKGRMKK